MNEMQLTEKGANFLQSVFLKTEDVGRFVGSLSKLSRQFEEPVILTGSVASGWHLLKHQPQIEKKPLNDIDVVVEGLSPIRSTLIRDFLIKHFHPFRGQGRILIQLVDQECRTRIDVFTPTTRTLTTRLSDLVISNISCRVVSVEDLSSILLSVIYPAIDGEPVDPKYIEHFHSLSAIADVNTMREVWREYRKESQLLEFEKAIEAVGRNIAARPDLLQRGQYSQDIRQRCQWCQESEVFPLAPPSRIYQILGYV